MLRKLTIENYALIKHLELRFESGFSTITGETGAGKSIMLDALGLVLGDRADSQVLWDAQKKCIVEGVFAITGYDLEPIFELYELDYEDETTLRREITPNGKSRAFVNDTPVTLQVLRELGSRLVNIHSQHEILVLNRRDFQLAMLDGFANLEEALKHYQERFKGFTALKNQLEALEAAHAAQLAREDYDRFMYDELCAANLAVGEMEQLFAELQELTHADEIKTELFKLKELFEGEVLNLKAELKSSLMRLQKLAAGQTTITFTERLQSVYLEISDLCIDLNKTTELIEVNPQRLEMVSERMDHLNHLLQKHRLQEVQELIEIRDEIERRLQIQEDLQEQIVVAKAELLKINSEIVQLAKHLSESRKSAAAPLSAHLQKVLSRLGMPDATLRISITPLDNPGEDGADKVMLLFSANKGMNPDLLSKIASGGELSRLMLAVKSVLSSKRLIPTIVFDEIDAGVSGEIAGKAGGLMLEMSTHMQVIAITHLPQIASKGQQHYLATKHVDQGRTISMVLQLTDKERIDAIARMLSDAEPTPESIANARKMLSINTL
jgi:DNA repair protein RecN (Recombination protein N)